MMTERAATKTSVRTCVGCGGRGAPAGMVRVIHAGEELAFDLAGGSFGRGAHVHPGCLDKACRGGFQRAFKANLRVDAQELRAHLRANVERRVVGLLLGARRAKQIAIGAEAACEALERGALAVLASDAGAVARRRETQRAIDEGRAVVFGDKRALGAIFSAEEVALAAVSGSIGEQVKRCLDLSAGAQEPKRMRDQ